MIPTTYAVPTEKTSPVFCRAFARGCGGPIQDGGPLQPGAVALWGSPRLWPLLQQARAERRTWYYGDKGYFGRGTFFRITRNRFQHDGSGIARPKRWSALGLEIQPWRTSGLHIVVCPNGHGQYRLFGLDAVAWIREVVGELARHTDRPVRIRWRTTKAGAWPLSEDLKNAWAVVVWTSNAAVDALVAGVPVFVQSTDSAAYHLGTPDLTRIERPVEPSDEERLRFFQVLAANQWTLEEIEKGVAWIQMHRRERAA